MSKYSERSQALDTLTFTLITIICLTAFLLYYIIMLAIRIRSNVLHGLTFHESLLAQISDLRLAKIMDSLNINKKRYVQQENIIDIHDHMNRCNTCENTTTCDDNLTNDKIDINSLDFCNNEATLQDLLDKQNSIITPSR